MSRLFKMALWILVISNICAGCSKQSPVVSEESSTDNTSRERSWAQVSQENIEFYDSLNLDGIGSCDDELYISQYRWCDNDAAVIVLQIRLGTGETTAEVIPTSGDVYLYFGHIFSVEKDAVVIQVGVSRSNYGASRLYVYNIYGADETDPFPPLILERFDCAGDNDFMPAIDADIQKDKIVVMGTEIVNMEGRSLQGIKLQFDNNNERWNNVEKTIYWTGDGWTVMK